MELEDEALLVDVLTESKLGLTDAVEVDKAEVVDRAGGAETVGVADTAGVAVAELNRLWLKVPLRL